MSSLVNLSTLAVIFLTGQSHHLSSNSFRISSSEKRFRINFAGLPPTMEYGSTSLVIEEL